jgi:GAF domain-containing protein
MQSRAQLRRTIRFVKVVTDAHSTGLLFTSSAFSNPGWVESRKQLLEALGEQQALYVTSFQRSRPRRSKSARRHLSLPALQSRYRQRRLYFDDKDYIVLEVTKH